MGLRGRPSLVKKEGLGTKGPRGCTQGGFACGLLGAGARCTSLPLQPPAPVRPASLLLLTAPLPRAAAAPFPTAVSCSCPSCVFTYNGTDVDGTSTQGGYSTHYVVNRRWVRRWLRFSPAGLHASLVLHSAPVCRAARSWRRPDASGCLGAEPVPRLVPLTHT